MNWWACSLRKQTATIFTPTSLDSAIGCTIMYIDKFMATRFFSRTKEVYLTSIDGVRIPNEKNFPKIVKIMPTCRNKMSYCWTTHSSHRKQQHGFLYHTQIITYSSPFRDLSAIYRKKLATSYRVLSPLHPAQHTRTKNKNHNKNHTHRRWQQSDCSE